MPDLRFRLHQLEHEASSISTRLVLQHSGVAFDFRNFAIGNPTEILQMTQGKNYSAPVLEDLLSREMIWEKSALRQDLARLIDGVAPRNLFPESKQGIHQILIYYLQKDCEKIAAQINDANYERWIKSDLERDLLRFQREQQHGVGILEKWRENLENLTASFYEHLQPFEQILSQENFLLGGQPVYVDYVLAGVIGNFLFSGATKLSSTTPNLQSWYQKMIAGEFLKSLDPLQMTVDPQSQSANAGKNSFLENIEDVKSALSDLKLRPGRKAIDVSTGAGETAFYLAEQGLEVTLSNPSAAMLEKAAAIAKERNLKIAMQNHAAEQLPYGEGSFDLVISRFATHQFNSPETFVREAARVLKMYGFFVLIDIVALDDHPDASAWLNEMEKWRDPGHVRYVKSQEWKQWAEAAGLKVIKSELGSLKMPDLNWYFEIANTPVENRKKILELIARAPASARDLFKIGTEDGKIGWSWRRIMFVAGKF